MRRFLVFAILCLVFATPLAAQFQSPEDAVKALYASYGPGNDPPKNGFDDKLAAQVFDPSLLDLYQRVTKSGNMDDDFFVQGNDFSLTKPIEIRKVSVDGEAAQVSAVLTQNLAGQKSPTHYFVFKLVKSDNGWQIDNVYCNGTSVRDVWNGLLAKAK